MIRSYVTIPVRDSNLVSIYTNTVLEGSMERVQEQSQLVFSFDRSCEDSIWYKLLEINECGIIIAMILDHTKIYLHCF